MNSNSEIDKIYGYARTGDVLHVRSKTTFGWAIRHGLSLGLHGCFGNHDAPVFYAQASTISMLQISSPVARVMCLAEYLDDLYSKGGEAILVRPDFLAVNHRRTKYISDMLEYATCQWEKMAGIPYDKQSIRMILRMIFRKSASILENDKTTFYCTEGTFAPFLNNPFHIWCPDELSGNNYPAPIHTENMIRQGRLGFVAGSANLYDKIKKG